MHIAFAIVSLFPDGGLQRNCLAIARILGARGHKPTIFAARTSGPLPDDATIELLPNNARTNHGRNLRFASDLAAATTGRFWPVIGFNKLPGLDLLYCAELCAAARGGWRRLTPRHRALRALEGACFAPGSNTQIVALSEPQIAGYRLAWKTEPHRITALPPNLERQRRQPQRRSDGTRERRRAALSLRDNDWCWLAIGRQARTKGLDRTIAALAAFPDAHLVVIGLNALDSKAAPVLKLARRLGVDRRLSLLGLVSDDDVPALMAAADLLVHPARIDTTGTVILEAIINGLPVVTTAVCGYASHVHKADAGLVVAEPFTQDGLVRALTAAGERRGSPDWSVNGMRYGERNDLYSGLEVAADIILRLAAVTSAEAVA